MNTNYKIINELFWIAAKIENRNKKEAKKLYQLVEELQHTVR